MIRCFSHGKQSTMVCTFKGCQHKTLCVDCIVTHPKSHLSFILPIKDFDPTSYTVPRTIAKDLSEVRQRMAMLQNHLIQTREIRKAEVRKLQKCIMTQFTDELENFLKTVHYQIEGFYNDKHTKIAEVIQNCEDHLNKLNSIINGEVENSRKFDFLLDLQDKLLNTIVPTLTQQAEEYSRLSMCSDIIVSQHFDKVLEVALERAFIVTNILVTEQKPVTLENQMYDSLALFQNEQNQKTQQQQKGVDFYRNQLKPYLPLDIVYKDIKVPHSSDFNRKVASPQDIKQNALPFEVFVSQQKHLNTILQGHFDIITSICVLSLSQIASAGGEGIIKFWDVDSQICLGTIEAHKGTIWCLAGIYDDMQTDVAVQLASGGNDRLIHIWNVKHMTLEFTLVGHLDMVKSLAYVKKFAYIISGGADYRVKLWNRDKCAFTIEDAHKNIVRAVIALDEQDSIASSGDSTIRVWSANKGILKMEMSHGADVHCLKELPNGQMASGGADRNIIIWDIKGGFKIQRLSAHHDIINGLAYHKYLLSVSNDKTLRVWDIAEGKQIKSIKAHQENISCVATNQYRELIFTAGWDKRIRIISLEYVMRK